MRHIRTEQSIEKKQSQQQVSIANKKLLVKFCFIIFAFVRFENRFFDAQHKKKNN
jgi:hypothetical protein